MCSNFIKQKGDISQCIPFITENIHISSVLYVVLAHLVLSFLLYHYVIPKSFTSSFLSSLEYITLFFRATQMVELQYDNVEL